MIARCFPSEVLLPWKSIVSVVVVSALVGAGVAAAVLVATGSKHSDDSLPTAQRSVALSGRELITVSRRLAAATRIADLQAAGREAEEAGRRIAAHDKTVSGLTDARVARRAQQLLASHGSMLAAYAQMASLGTPTDADVTRVEGAIKYAESQLDAGRAPVTEKLVAPVTGQAMAGPDAHAVQLLDSAARKLAGWQRRVTRIRRERKARLAAINAYATTVQGRIDAYDELRTKLGDWIRSVDEEGATFGEAYTFLSAAAESRVLARDGLRGISAPHPLARQHSQIIIVIGRAVDAVQSASVGISDFQFDRESYDSYKDTPGWQDFKTKSDDIASSFTSAVATWKARLAKLRRSLVRGQLPKHPSV